MSVPWLRIVGGLLGLGEAVRAVRGRSEPDAGRGGLARTVRGLAGVEMRLAGAVVAALKEAFDRDHERLELERSQIEAQHRRAERALQLEMLRQAGDREMGRLRLITGVALVSWLSTLLLARGAATLWPRLAFGLGWILLLAALATGLVAQSRVARVTARVDDRFMIDDVIEAGSLAAAAPRLLVGGLAAIGAAVLLA
jgi:hypothetical protein